LIIDDEVAAVLLAIAIVASVFAIAQILLSTRVVEPFSELGLLGPRAKIGDYPKEVLVGEKFKLYVYVGNHEGRTTYYKLLVKLGNASTFVNSSVPADAPVIKTLEVILVNNATWLYPLVLSINETGINYKLIIEMWVYDPEIDDFKYHGRWVHLWLNVTKP